MKTIFTIIIILCCNMILIAQESKTVEATPGNLSSLLTEEEKNTVTNLTITGTIDARDFKTMRDEMPVLADLDMSAAQIIAYEGDEGPSEATTVYAADAIPRDAFHIPSFGLPSLQSVVIPLTTKVIGPYAFNTCTGLTTFTIPSSVTAIQTFAFGGCYNLTSITIPESVETIGESAFAACKFTSIILPSQIDSIQSSTFASCDALVSIDIPSSVTYIGEQAFSFCASLESITIPSLVKIIAEYAFYKCIGLKTITLPESMTYIGQSAFNECTSLEGTVILPEGLSTIEASTFESCSSLTSVVIPSSVDSIGEAAFIRCTNLESVTLPSSIVYIGNSAFVECSSLSGTLTLPSSLETLGSSAFAGCTNLTGELIIPPKLSIIPVEAFSYCRNLTSLVIPSSVNSIHGNAFEFMFSLTSIEVHHLFPLVFQSQFDVFEGVDKSLVTLHVPFGTGERYASAYIWEDFENIVEDVSGFLLSGNSVNFGTGGGTDNSIVVTADFAWTATSDQSWLTVSPGSAEGSQTLAITAEANSGLSTREGTITLSAEGVPSQTIRVTQQSDTHVLSITPGGLSDALSEEEKQMISSLTLTGSMDARDFRTIRIQMPLLEVLDIKEVTIVAYTDNTFGNNILFPEDAIPFALQEFNEDPKTDYSLSEHDKLRVIILPNTLKTIGYRALFACNNLTTVEMQSSVESIGNEAFYYCIALTEINLPSSLTSIGAIAFASCSSLLSIELPSSLEEIKYRTFEGCRALESVVIPSSITSIQDNAFKGCSSLASVTLPSALILINRETFMDCSSLTMVDIPSNVTMIGEFAFMGCSDLQTLILPGSLTAIAPAGFADCISLDTIYIYAVNPPDLNISTGWDVFDKVDKTNCLLYVPLRSKHLYESAYGWKEFENIVEMGEFSLDETEVTLEAGENSEATVKLHSSIQWTASSDQEWLTVDPTSGGGGHWLTLTADANQQAASRSAIVTISAEDVEYPLIIFVTQHGITVGMKELESGAQVKYYPNPFTHEMAIEVANSSLGNVSVKIYNLSGQRVKNLARDQNEAKISLIWDGTNEQGEKVPEGVYILKVNEAAWQVVKGNKK